MDGSALTTTTTPNAGGSGSSPTPPKKVVTVASDPMWDNIIRQATEGLQDTRQAEKDFIETHKGDQALLKSLAEWKAPDPPPVPTVSPSPKLELTNPLEAFGQFGTMFAVMGSLLTRRPLVNGLNAAANAINSIRKNDYNNYLVNLQNWKDQTDYTFKLADYQNNRYQAIIDSHNADVQTKIAFIRTEAAANHDWVVLKQAELGDLQLIEQTMYDRAYVLQKGRTAYKGAYSMGSMLGDLITQYRNEHDGQDPPPELVGQWNRSLRGQGTPKGLTAVQIQKNAQIHQARDYIAKLNSTAEGKTTLTSLLNGSTPFNMLNPGQQYIVNQYKLAQLPLYGDQSIGGEGGTDQTFGGDAGGGDTGGGGKRPSGDTQRPTEPGAVMPLPNDFAGDPDGTQYNGQEQPQDAPPEWEKHGKELWWIGEGSPPAASGEAGGGAAPGGDASKAPPPGPPYGGARSDAGIDWFNRTVKGAKDTFGNWVNDNIDSGP